MAFVFALLCAWGLGLGFVWLMAKRPQGYFRVSVDTAERFAWSSDCGQFTLHRSSGTLAWLHEGQRFSTKLADMRGFDYLSNEEEDWIGEFAFGFDFTDMWSRYRDTIEWHEIAILASPQGRVPVFRSGRLQRREFAFTWFIDLQERFMVWLGLLEDVDKQARETLELLESRFGKGLA